jgi:uncharacterized protein
MSHGLAKYAPPRQNRKHRAHFECQLNPRWRAVARVAILFARRTSGRRSNVQHHLPLPEGMPVKLWIDADAAPRDVKEIVFRAAKRLELPTVLVANQRLQVPPGNAFVTAVRVEGGPDVADLHIAEEAEPGDVAVTADIPLASALVAKGVRVIDPRGDEFTAENIGERLTIRDFMDSMRGAGMETGGARPYGPKDKQAFAGALDRVLTRALRDAR